MICQSAALTNVEKIAKKSQVTGRNPILSQVLGYILQGDVSGAVGFRFSQVRFIVNGGAV
jgi:hypothetical protein